MDPTSPPPPVTPPTAPPTPEPGGTRIPQSSIWSLVFGILSFCLWILGSIPAIILGIIGIKKSNADPAHVGGRGLAITGIVTGALGTVLGVGPILFSLSLPAYNRIQDRAVGIKEINNVRIVTLGCRAYAADHEGLFPEKLQDLYPDYVDSEEVFFSSPNADPPSRPLRYRPGFSDTSPGDEPFILSPVENRGNLIVAFVSGYVREVRPPESESIRKKFNE